MRDEGVWAAAVVGSAIARARDLAVAFEAVEERHGAAAAPRAMPPIDSTMSTQTLLPFLRAST